MTSHKLTPMFLALTTLIALASLSFGQVPTTGLGLNLVPANDQPKIIEVSDQKPGSLLVYPYYTSNAQTRADTRITLTNLAGTLSAVPNAPAAGPQNGSIIVHLFFLRGTDCQQSDQFVCLTKGASVSFKMSDQDPETTGYVIAVAVDAMGNPVSWNALIGNAFVNAGDIVGNYGAESFASVAPAGQISFGAQGNGTYQLFLDGFANGYDRPADQFAVEIQSPSDATGQTIVHASVSGNVNTAAVNVIAQSGTGLVVRGDEKQGSFVRFISGNCQSINVVNTIAPRVPTGLGVFLPKGSIATMVYATSNPSVGLIMTPRGNAWSGIRTLHKTRTKAATLDIPIFMPVC
jgi:phage baseplate assembly protein gpV